MQQPDLAESSLRHRRRSLHVFSVAIVVTAVLDVFVAKSLPWAAFAVRGVWAACYLGAAALMPRVRSKRQRRLLDMFIGATTSLAYLGLCASLGGSDCPYFPLLPLLPVLNAVVHYSGSSAAISTGMAATLGSTGLLALEGKPSSHILVQAFVVGALTLVGMFAASQARKALRSQAQAHLERERRAALERLTFSEHRRAETEKLATVGKMAANLMHEVNTPLAYLTAQFQSLQAALASRDKVPWDEVDTSLKSLDGGFQWMQQILSDLQGYARMGEEGVVECSLAEVVDDAARLARPHLEPMTRLEVDVPAELPPVRVVRQRLVQVLHNLLVNAGEALAAANVKDGRVRVEARIEDGYLMVRVEDNGPGFPPHVLTHLFEAFFTTKAEGLGTGLGLATSRELVEQHGGTLTATNREEGGASLCVALPLEPAAAEPQPAAA